MIKKSKFEMHSHSSKTKNVIKLTNKTYLQSKTKYIGWLSQVTTLYNFLLNCYLYFLQYAGVGEKITL